MNTHRQQTGGNIYQPAIRMANIHIAASRKFSSHATFYSKLLKRAWRYEHVVPGYQTESQRHESVSKYRCIR